MEDSELKAIELGHVCSVHKIILDEDGICLSCETGVEAWKPIYDISHYPHQIPHPGYLIAGLIIGGLIAYFAFCQK